MPFSPKRLIEVDFPVKRVSKHARREKSIRHGHISTLHVWWGRRPLASCRAVLCAALWPDPADPDCPQAFRDVATAALHLHAFNVRAEKTVSEITGPGRRAWHDLLRPGPWLDPLQAEHQVLIRELLLDFIADFATWEASTEKHYIQVARVLTQAAHLSLEDTGWRPPNEKKLREALAEGTRAAIKEAITDLQSALKAGPRPVVADPFAGGGSIPLETLRVGADAFASDLNPVAVLLNKVAVRKHMD